MTSAAKARFDVHMQESADALKIYEFLAKNGYRADFGLRYIWVASVSALDHYISELIIEVLTENFANNIELCPKAINEKIPLSSLIRIRKANPIEAVLIFKSIVSDLVRYRTFQKADDVADGLAYIWAEENKWDKLSKPLGLNHKVARRKLNSICYRRDMIVHNADYNGASGSLTNCDPLDAGEAADYIKRLVGSIDENIKP